MHSFITICKRDYSINAYIKFHKNSKYKCIRTIGTRTYRKITELYDFDTNDYICSFYYENFIIAFYTEQEIRKIKLDKLNSL